MKKRVNMVVGQGIARAAAPKVSGMMEVIPPEDGFVLETRLPLSRHNGLGRTDAMKEQKNRQNGRLHVFGPKEEVIIEPVQTMQRENALTRIAKNKNLKMSVRLQESIEEETEIHNDQQLNPDLQRLNHETKIIEAKTEPEVNDEKMKNSSNVEKIMNNEIRAEIQKDSVDKQTADEKPSDSSDDDEINGQSENEAKKRIAPLQLMGEFLKAIMDRKYSLAKKLCQMILIYEPENPEAKQFLPLIEKKLLLESERAATEGEETGEESSDDSEEDTSNTDNSDTESEGSSENSDKNT
ncbi:glutamate-rich protein 2 isoform X2 [Sceloporus undulatus]|uniref:glutamate-rich protein 2 isoform X2 n=1 Tax=Sceloporus undulatus TaxID=8520 RepID=UPI001C4C0787|nr:glutamate-rich protein 2 isoform X2 [Sceloporus undulatus]